MRDWQFTKLSSIHAHKPYQDIPAPQPELFLKVR
jgi:hypothetical protein